MVVLVGTLGVAAPAHAVAFPPKHCGWVVRFVEVRAQNVGCPMAMKVARREWKGNKHPLGYTCREIKVKVAAGWWDRCTKGRAVVAVIPN